MTTVRLERQGKVAVKVEVVKKTKQKTIETRKKPLPGEKKGREEEEREVGENGAK